MEFTINDLSKFIDSGKNVCVYSKDISKMLQIYKPQDFSEFSNRLFYYWIKSEKPIPIFIVIKIMQMQNQKIVKIDSFSVGSGNKINSPKEDYYFYYFLGLLLGDGCLVHRIRGKYQNMYHAQISFATKLEAELGKQITRHIFNIESSIYEGKGCWNLCIHSKPLVIILNSFYQVPIGEKYSTLVVPNLVKNSSKKLITYFLKGVFESDGNIYNYRKGKSVQLRQKSKKFLEELRLLFVNIGILFNNPYYDRANNSWVIWSSKKELVDNFIKKIIELKIAAPVAQPG